MSDFNEPDATASESLPLGSNAEASSGTPMATDGCMYANDCDGKISIGRDLDDQLTDSKEKDKEEALEAISGEIYEAYERIRITGIDAREWRISRTDPESFDLVDKDCSKLIGRSEERDKSYLQWFTYRKQYEMCRANLENYLSASLSLPPLTDSQKVFTVLGEAYPYRVKRATQASENVPVSTLQADSTPNDSLSTSEHPPLPPSPSSNNGSPTSGTPVSRPSSIDSHTPGSSALESGSQSTRGRTPSISGWSKKLISPGPRYKESPSPPTSSNDSRRASNFWTRSNWKEKNRCG